ncbi:hypothetical protein T492DRAFT_1035853 [Pavlovales sp. CCMP2436]|nr:hypothetical protein T492DRAFT_1035853 [Pavlovales sp. CCMP2436]
MAASKLRAFPIMLGLLLLPAVAGWHGLGRSALSRLPASGVAHGPRMMYSDSRPTIEYMEFLMDGGVVVELDDGPSLIIGGGKLGTALLGPMGFDGDRLLKRGEPIPVDFVGAIHVCVPADELQNVIDACPPDRYDDLVFWQSPTIEPVLKRCAMIENTQVCSYFHIDANANLVDVTTDINPEGLTSTMGKWGFAVIQRLARAELSCKMLNKRDYKRAAIERHIWDCAFHVIGAVQGHMSGKPMTVGDVEKYSFNELEPMIRQSRPLLFYSAIYSSAAWHDFQYVLILYVQYAIDKGLITPPTP